MSVPRVRLALSSDAQDDLESIYLYGYQVWDAAAAERYFSRIADALDLLARFPHLGRRRDDLATDLYALSVAQHAILYRFGGDVVFVLRILHERVDPGSLSESL